MKATVNPRFFAMVFALGLAMLPQAARASVISVTNLTIVPPPATVGSNYLVNAGLPDAIIFDEMQNITLATALTTDTGVIPAGTVIDSEFFATQSNSAVTLNSLATFSGNVLGIIYLDGSANWATSDFLGAPGTTYLEDPNVCPQCGFESGDTVTIVGNTVDFSTTFSEPGDFARVITGVAPASATPEPGSMLLLSAGAIALLAKQVRRRPVSASVPR